MQPRESEIQKAIMDWLKASGILHWRCSLGGVRQGSGVFAKNPMKGYPDLAGICPTTLGRLFAIEVKRPGGKLSEDQLKWKSKLERQGVKYLVATSVEDVRRELDPIGWQTTVSMATGAAF